MKTNGCNALAAILAGALMWSCGDNGKEEPEARSEAVSAPSLTYVVDDEGNGSALEGASYKVVFIENKGTADIEMTGVRYNGQVNSSAYKFGNVTFKVEVPSGTKVITVDRVVPDNASSPVFTDLETVVLADKEIDFNGDGKPVTAGGFAIKYVVDGKYKVTDIPFTSFFEGTTTTTNSTNQNTFVTSKSTYIVELDKDMKKAVLKINNPSFDEKMPPLGTMVFGSFDSQMISEYGSIDVTFVDGGYELGCSSLIPFIAGTPYPRFAVTNLKMTVKCGGDSELKFNCMGVYGVTAMLGCAYTQHD